MSTTEHLETETPQDNYEARYKEVQAWGTRTSQENARLKAENEALKQIAPKVVNIDLSEDVQAELDTLLDTDPDAWRLKMNQLEAQAKQKFNTELEQAQADALRKAELTRREQVLEAFVNNPDTVLTTASLEDIPVRIQKQLEEGELTFEEFLVTADTYLKTNKVIDSANPETLVNVALDKQGGSATPNRTEEGVEIAYEKAIF